MTDCMRAWSGARVWQREAKQEPDGYLERRYFASRRPATGSFGGFAGRSGPQSRS
jgi:hypothetical protein